MKKNKTSNKEVENIKKDQTENLELKNIITELKNSLEVFNNILDYGEEIISKLEDRPFEIIYYCWRSKFFLK